MPEESKANRPVVESRVIRVFISSTFRDMMRERDLLVKEVFSELRRKCAKRLVAFTEVDLRWGITEAQANEGQVLPLCLAEIERSRPYFIGLLGERYGWIPDTIRPEVIEREPWLQEHVRGRTSVTELEILHGVLNNPKMQGHAFFYFRDPTWVDNPALSDGERWDMVEHDIRADVERHGQADATRRKEERKVKLAALKQRIRDSTLPLAEPYPNPKTLARIVRRQLNRLIDRLYPEDQGPDPLAQERMAHEAYAKNKLFACIDRPVHLEALNAFAAPAEHDGKGLVVTGESGAGKTVLLAAWARDWAKHHPEDFLFQHFFGATSESASPEGFLRRLLAELKSRFGIAADIPTDPDKLRDTLPLWLAQIVGKRIVLVLDGLNQVRGSEPDRRLLFLPRHFSPHVTVLASALSGPAMDTLREGGWAEHNLPPTSGADVDVMVGEYLRIHARTLEPALRHQLVAAPGAKNPLFLRTVLEELRQFGSFERLPQRVRHYLEAGNPKDLFLRVLTRWQADFDGKDPEQDKPNLDLVRRSLTPLWAARQGLSEPEWLDLLGDGSQPLPRALWTPLFLALEPHLSQHAGLFVFGHDFLRQAVETAFVSSGNLQKAAHLSLADYFERHAHQREMMPRKAAEWPHQLCAAEAWDRLEACLTDVPLFLSLYHDKTKWELASYWLPLRQQGCDLGACYEAAYVSHASASPDVGFNAHLANEFGIFLYENGFYPAAESLLRRALEIDSHGADLEDRQLLASLNNLALLLMNKGDYAAAQPLCRRVLAGSQRTLGREHPATLQRIDTLACLLMHTGNVGTAERLFRSELASGERVLGPEHPQTLTSLHNLAFLLTRKGDYAGAEPLIRRVLETRERVLGREHPDTLLSLNNLAALLMRRGDYAGAEQLSRRAAKAYERVLGPEHPDTLASVNNLALSLQAEGNYDAARSLLRDVVRKSERTLGPKHPSTLGSMNDLAYVLERKGDFEGAAPLYRRVLTVREQVLGVEHHDTLISMNNLAHVLEDMGDYTQAETLQRRALETQQKTLGPEHPLTLGSANNLACLLETKGDLENAEPLFRRVLEGRIRVLGPEHPDTLTSLDNLGGLLKEKGDYTQAEQLRRRALSGFEKILGPEHPDTLTSVSNLAAVMWSKGDCAAAEPLCRRALQATERVFGPEHPDTIARMERLAEVLLTQGETPEAESLYRRVLEICEGALGTDHPRTLNALDNLAGLLYSQGDYAAAEPLCRRALEGRERVLGLRHPDTLMSANGLATVLYFKGDYAAAEPLYRRAVTGWLAVRRVPEQDRHLKTLSDNYINCLIKLGLSESQIRDTIGALLMGV
jgi:tetratricopeptide (TPR) repeat protein